MAQGNKLERLMEAIDGIVAANTLEQNDLFGENPLTRDVIELLDIQEQDPEKSYELYYRNIQPFLNLFIPKDNEINRPIRELVCILLTGKEKKNLTYGKRGADSRQAKTPDMENLIEVLIDWSTTPNDYFRLSNILLNKNKELEYIPQERSLADYIPN
ncbi:MAG: hypothetical protein PWQ53_481 [Bacteroidota bacterium]|jgi:hypothetical protein|nr:hypothetical protein [Bacteroidota bacterium]MDK2979227.1 hypothetical protein [Bacteroidales bacterium]MDN5291054.1 hypothetical protein [Anaerophaga sp.]MDN5305822.1 hypothetical protein [Bacteroidota bacterium]